MLSHELRNPISAITFSLDYLNEADVLPEGASDVHQLMIRQAAKVSKLLDDLLDVSRVTHNRIEFKKTNHDINRSVVDAVNSIRHRAESKNLAISLDICPDCLFVFGDEMRLNQAVSNLLDNAVKYTPEFGKIWVVTKRIQDQIVLSVRDSGLGIAKQSFASIFDLFFQGDRSIHRSSGGMGVGLFIVNQIIAGHGGSILVSSDGPNRGCQFEVHLPLAPRAPESIEESLAADLGHLHVALIEDNDDARKLTALLLAKKGFRVSQFADGESASLEVPKIHPDVAVIDIGLPGKSGLDLAVEFRNDSRMENTCLIALTGYGQESDRAEVSKAGFDVHLVKPIRIGQLCEAIANPIKV